MLIYTADLPRVPEGEDHGSGLHGDMCVQKYMSSGAAAWMEVKLQVKNNGLLKGSTQGKRVRTYEFKIAPRMREIESTISRIFMFLLLLFSH